MHTRQMEHRFFGATRRLGWLWSVGFPDLLFIPLPFSLFWLWLTGLNEKMA